ncbi:hypothetical protein BO221_39115 [Archangium sp. Cb G35]|nr:hypothetical protein BO221_39115 [Archangium sp. Cb G35]
MKCSLLIAAVGSIATSPVSSPSFVSQFQGTPFVLTHETPKVSRTLVISISMGETEHTENHGSLTIEGTARWRPANPSAPGQPWVTARVGSGEGQPWSAAAVLDTPDAPVPLLVMESLQVNCNTGDVCEIPVTVEFEFQDGGIEGTVEMEWKATSSMELWNDDELPQGYSVTITERGEEPTP